MGIKVMCVLLVVFWLVVSIAGSFIPAGIISALTGDTLYVHMEETRFLVTWGIASTALFFLSREFWCH